MTQTMEEKAQNGKRSRSTSDFEESGRQSPKGKCKKPKTKAQLKVVAGPRRSPKKQSQPRPSPQAVLAALKCAASSIVVLPKGVFVQSDDTPLPMEEQSTHEVSLDDSREDPDYDEEVTLHLFAGVTQGFFFFFFSFLLLCFLLFV